MINVAINGYGVIGKRVADAAAAQPDMNGVGVADTATDYRVALARHDQYELYGSTSAAMAEMTSASPIGGSAVVGSALGRPVRCHQHTM